MMRGRLLAIDHGIKRLGLAVCDQSQLVAKELMVLKRQSRQEDFDRILRIIDDHAIAGIVVGLPSDLDAPDHVHSQADTVRLWVERLQGVISLPVMFWDEQFTSQDALILARQKRRRSSEPIDDLAARLILQSYLDAVKDGLAAPFPPDTVQP